jgi:hypothetical protein
MISPKAVNLIIQYFDAIDEAVAKRMVRKRPWSEPALTSLLCDLLDENTQDEERLRYTLAKLNNDLSELDGLFNVSFSIETHEYDSRMERWVTQADLGFIIKFEDCLLPSESWCIAWLLQAKRLYPDSRDPLRYTEVSHFRALDSQQKLRMKILNDTIGIPFVRFLLYCPRPLSLDEEIRRKLTYLRNKRLSSNIFDYTLGLKLHDELSSSNSSLAAGIFVTKSIELPTNLSAIHANILGAFCPLSWFLASHLVEDRLECIDDRIRFNGRISRKSKRLSDDNDGDPDWAKGIVSGDPDAIERLLSVLNEKNQGSFPVLPAHTLTVKISVGKDMNPDTRRIKHE